MRTRRSPRSGNAVLRLGGGAILAALAVGSQGGCTREFYREWANQDVSEAVFEKSRDPRWRLDTLLRRAAGAVAVRRPLRPGCAAGPARRRRDRGALARPAVAQQPADRAGGRHGLPGAAGILAAPGAGRRPPRDRRRSRRDGASRGIPEPSSGPAAQPGRRRLPGVAQHRPGLAPGHPVRAVPGHGQPLRPRRHHRAGPRRSTPTSRPGPRPCRSCPAPAARWHRDRKRRRRPRRGPARGAGPARAAPDARRRRSPALARLAQ